MTLDEKKKLFLDSIDNLRNNFEAEHGVRFEFAVVLPDVYQFALEKIGVRQVEAPRIEIVCQEKQADAI